MEGTVVFFGVRSGNDVIQQYRNRRRCFLFGLFPGYIARTSTARPNLSSEGAHAIDKTILVNVNRNKYPVVKPTWALKPGLTDRLVVGCNVTLTLT
jgi:hypothetical protein